MHFLLCAALFIFLNSPFHLLSQNRGSKLNLESFGAELFIEELIKSINDARAEHDLHALDRNKILGKAALNQSKYNRKYGQADREQSKRKMATVNDRVRSFNGLFYSLDEYDLGVEVQTKKTLRKRSHGKPETYGQLVDHVIEEWKDERRLDALLYSNEFYNVGIGVSANHIEDLVFVSIVLGSESYQKKKSFSYHKKGYKIRPYDRDVCRDIERNYSYLPELLSDNLKIVNRKIIFEYHDLSLVENLMEFGKDALAVDVLEKSQFDCIEGNKLHPSSVHDGMMLKPVKKGKLLKKNPYREQKEFKAVLGTLPAGLDTSDIVLSLMIIKSKCLCQKIPRNKLNGKNIRLLKLGLAVDTISISQSIDSNTRYLEFVVPFEQGKSDYLVEDIKPFLDSIQLNRFNIKEIDINAYSSIEGTEAINLNLQQKRAESIIKAIGAYQLQEVKTKIETFEDWEGFKSSIKGSPYEKDFRGLSKEEARRVLNADTFHYNVEPYLADQRRAEIRIFVESIYIDSLTPEKLPEKFLASLGEDHIRAKALQSLMYRAVLDGQLDTSVLFTGEIPQTKEYVPLANNRLAFQMQFDNSDDPDSLLNNLRMEVEALLGVEESNGHLSFNKQTIKLYYWAKDLNYLVVDEENHVDQPRDFLRDIRKLYNTKIDNFKVNRLFLNYNIIAADFYYEKQDFRKRVRALKQVRKYVKKAALDRDQTLTMARYFIYQMQIGWAVQTMLPFIKNDNYDEEFLATFLSLMVYEHKKIKEEEKYAYFRLAAEKYPKRLCEMFGDGGMSEEFLSDIELKSIYCEQCK